MKADDPTELLRQQRKDLTRRIGKAMHEWVDANGPAVFPHAAVIALLERATTMAQTGSAAYREAAVACFRAALGDDHVAFDKASKAMHEAMVAGGMHHRASG